MESGGLDALGERMLQRTRRPVCGELVSQKMRGGKKRPAPLR